MIAAGLLAKKAIERGLKVQPHVKTTFAPGSRVVTRYLEAAGLTPYLEQLGFFLVGFGCTVCIAEGTPVLQANGTARRIEDLPTLGGSTIFGPAPDGGITMARQTALIAQGVRECVDLVLQDGRTLTCTPDHRSTCPDPTNLDTNFEPATSRSALTHPTNATARSPSRGCSDISWMTDRSASKAKAGSMSVRRSTVRRRCATSSSSLANDQRERNTTSASGLSLCLRS